MTETVLAMPFIFVVLSLLLFFGWGMERMHRSVVVDRYDAWRHATKAPGPRSHGERDTTGELNTAFYADNADQLIDASARSVPFDAPRYWERAVGQQDSGAGRFAEHVHEDLPRIVRSRFKSEHSTNIPFWNKIGGEKMIDHQHVRFGHDWRFVNHVLEDDDTSDQRQRWFHPPSRAWHQVKRYHRDAGRWVPTLLRTRAMKDTYFRPLDERIKPIARAGNGLGRMFRALYIATPHYRGPKISQDWIDNYQRDQNLGG